MKAYSCRNRAYAAALVAAAGLAAPTGASAAESVTVSYRDLNLGQPEALAVLQGRVRAAARVVCGAPERGEVGAVLAQQECYRQAIARGMTDAQAGRQPVANLHQASVRR